MTDRESFSSEDLLRQAKESLARPARDVPTYDPVEPRTASPEPDAVRSAAPPPPAPRRDPVPAPPQPAPRPRIERRPPGPPPTDRIEPYPGVPGVRRHSPIGALVRVVALALAAMAALGFFAQFAETTGEVSSEEERSLAALPAGTCFNGPGPGTITGVAQVDCATAHQYEVIGSVPLSGGAYPGADALERDAFESCRQLFDSYVAAEYRTLIWGINVITPAEVDWQAGDRVANCLISRRGSNDEILSVPGSARGDGP